jgi:hypothetical protein
MGNIVYTMKPASGEILSTAAKPKAARAYPDIITVRHFVFSDEERDIMGEILDARADKEAIIKELESVCNEVATAKAPDRINRAGQLKRLQKKLMEFETTLQELQEYAGYHLNDSMEIHNSASDILSKMIRLNSLIDSRADSMKFKSGRPGQNDADVIAAGVKLVFDEFGIPFSTSDDSLFRVVLSECLKAIGLPFEEPGRRIKKLRTKPLQKK